VQKDLRPTYRSLDKQPTLAMVEPLSEKLRGLSILKGTLPLAGTGLRTTIRFFIPPSDKCNDGVLMLEIPLYPGWISRRVYPPLRKRNSGLKN